MSAPPEASDASAAPPRRRLTPRVVAAAGAAAVIFLLLALSSRSATRALARRRTFQRTLLLVEDNSSTIAGAPPTVLVESSIRGARVLRSCSSWACVGGVGGTAAAGSDLAPHVARNLHASAGIALLFHSCAHSSKAAWLGMPRERAIVRALHAADLHVVALSSPIAGSPDGCWDLSPQPRPPAAAAPAGAPQPPPTDSERVAAVLAALLREAGEGVAPQLAPRTLAALGLAGDPWLEGGAPEADAAGGGAGGRFTHPVFAVGVASGGSFALQLATRLRLTGVVALSVSRPLPFAVAPLLQLPAPRDAPPRPTGPFLVEGGGGVLARDPSAADAGAGAGAGAAAGSLAERQLRQALRDPGALPPLLLLAVLPGDATLRPPLSASLASAVLEAGLPAAAEEASLWGLSPPATAAAALRALLAAAAAARMADAAAAASALAQLSPPPPAVTPSAGVSVLPLTPRPLCPWTLHTAAPWAVSPAASAALFQALADSGALLEGGGQAASVAHPPSRIGAAMAALRAAVGLGDAAAEGGGAPAAAAPPPAAASFSRYASAGRGALAGVAASALAALADSLLDQHQLLRTPASGSPAPPSAGPAAPGAAPVPEACLLGPDGEAAAAAQPPAQQQQSGRTGQRCFSLRLALSVWPPPGTLAAPTPALPEVGGVPVSTALLPDRSAAYATACRGLALPPASPPVAEAVAAWAAALAPAVPGAADRLPTHESLCGGGGSVGGAASGSGGDCWPQPRERTGVPALDAEYWGVRLAASATSAGAAAVAPAGGADSEGGGGGEGGLRGLAAAAARQVLEDLYGTRGVASDLHLGPGGGGEGGGAVGAWLRGAAAEADGGG